MNTINQDAGTEKTAYEQAEINIIIFETQDIICTSQPGPIEDGEEDLFY